MSETKAQALALYAQAYRDWAANRISASELMAAEIRAKQSGANIAELNQAIAPKWKREPAP